MPTKNKHAVELGRRGGRVKSPRKTAAARANAQKGGRPPDYEVVVLDDGTADARITKRITGAPRVWVRTWSAGALAALAAWMKEYDPEAAVSGMDEDGRVYFGREQTQEQWEA
jgi:hypothetical protein